VGEARGKRRGSKALLKGSALLDIGKTWEIGGEARGKHGGSGGEAGGSRGVLRGSTFLDPAKTWENGGKQSAPVPLLKF